MCRNIKTLVHVEPLATGLEIREAALRFARKVSGFNGPSKANAAAFTRAVQKGGGLGPHADSVVDHQRRAAQPPGGSGQGEAAFGPPRRPAAQQRPGGLIAAMPSKR